MMPFYAVARFVTKVAYLLLYRVEYIGRENIPQSGGYVVACNHISLADPLFVAHGINKRQVHYLAKTELSKGWFMKFIMKSLGTIPVDRGSNDAGAINAAEQALVDGKLVGIFPEGTRSKTGELGTAKAGVALFVRSAKANVLPCAVICDGRPRFFKKITVKYGKPMTYQELFLSGEKTASLRQVANKVMESIAQIIDSEEQQ